MSNQKKVDEHKNNAWIMTPGRAVSSDNLGICALKGLTNQLLSNEKGLYPGPWPGRVVPCPGPEWTYLLRPSVSWGGVPQLSREAECCGTCRTPPPFQNALEHLCLTT